MELSVSANLKEATRFKYAIENNFETSTKELNETFEYIATRYDLRGLSVDDICEVYSYTLNTLYS